MGYTIADCILIPLLLIGIFFAVRGICRWIRASSREVTDNYRIYRRGVLNPIQVRQEFIDTTGREPTIAEVHDLHEMIESEYRHSRNWLIAAGAGLVGVAAIYHHELNK